jgi:hypothetical protein
MSLHKYSKSNQKLISFLQKMSLSLGVILVLNQGGIALSKPVLTSQLPNNIDLTDLLNGQVPDILVGDDQGNSSDEPEVIVEGGEQGDEQGTEQGGEENGDVVVGSDDPRFTCAVHEGKYTVMYHPESQPGEAYPWAIPSQMGDDWSPQRRCEVISSRLESYRPDGLVELTTGKVNGYDILCVTTEANPACRIVLTVPVGQDPEITRDDIFESLTVADSGESTSGVYTFTEGDNPLNGTLGNIGNILNGNMGILNPTLGGNTSYSGSGIYLKPFLDGNDGGTGAYLNHQNSSNTRQTDGIRLDPNIFR